MEEIWKDIVNFENYQVSNLGNVRRIKKDGTTRNLKLRVWGKYYQVDLTGKTKKHNTRYVHRLVAEHFIPNPRFVNYVNHKDGNKLNNCVDNLEWLTNEENLRHAITTLGHAPFGHKPVPVRAYDLKTKKLIKEFVSIGEAVAFAKQYKATACRSHISECCGGKIKSAYGFIWEYAD